MKKELDFLTFEYPEEQEKIRRMYNELIEAVESLDIDRLETLHFYGPKFARIEDGKRLDGSQCRELEKQLLSSFDKATYKSSNLQIDVFGKTAIVTVDYDVETQTGGESSSLVGTLTLVLVRVDDQWKITYERG